MVTPIIGVSVKIKDPALIRQLCSIAYRDIPLKIQLIFTNKLQSLATLQEKKIIEYNSEKDLYEFKI